MEDSEPEIAALLAYCQKTQARKNPIGFEVSIDPEAALAWIRKHRFEVYKVVFEASQL